MGHPYLFHFDKYLIIFCGNMFLFLECSYQPQLIWNFLSSCRKGIIIIFMNIYFFSSYILE